MAKIGVMGSGVVGETLANGFLKYGDEVMRASREPAKLEEWRAGAGVKASVGTFADAARHGDVIVLAVKGTAAERVIELAGPDALAGKLVLDATNPIADEPPDGGVIRYFTGPNESLMERLVARAPKAHFVKAFSSVGNARMVNPDYGGVRPTMFICGADADAKTRATSILERFGWEAVDVGGPAAARAVEPLAMLWCIPGFLRGEWTHAFHLLR